MAWQDRSYYRDSDNDAGPMSWFVWLISGSIPLYTAFGIRVRMHASLVIFLVWGLITAGLPEGMGWKNALTLDVVLFGIILLHEYGHCFAARSVGGEAHDILLWPLGGLAFADAPKRAWPQFVTVAGGPLVNLIICALMIGGLVIVDGSWPTLPWNPLQRHFSVPFYSQTAYYLWFIFVVSWGNFLFNVLIPVYPMDAWRLLQASLWFKIGYYRSMMIALVVGMVFAVPMTLWGLMNFGSWYGIVLILIGANGFYWCYRMRIMMRAEGPWAFQEEDGLDYSSGLFKQDEEDHHKHRKLNKRLLKKAQKREAEERDEQERVDQILAKVSAHGMHSLTFWEKRALKKATERQRKRDTELHEEMGRKGF